MGGIYRITILLIPVHLLCYTNLRDATQSFGVCAANNRIVSRSDSFRNVMQGNVVKACITPTCPYLAPLLKMDNLRSFRKHVSD